MQSPPHHSERRWSNRDVRRQVDRHRAFWLWGLLLGLAIAAIPTAIHLYQQNLCVRLGYEINALRSEQALLLEQHRRLLEQQATLEAPASVEAWGMDRRGMVRPSPDQVVVVRRTVPGRGDLLAQETRSDRE
jgi:cell division protein FtsL